ncbi:MAG TPA: hypothetical protein VK689_20890, partial [Armatimonadota bacterium]|nr:hypothetical protein [Armatimonadota bacterium]
FGAGDLHRRLHQLRGLKCNGCAHPLTTARQGGARMTTINKEKEVQAVKVERPERAKLTEEETLERMKSFEDRKEQFVASVRKGKG